MKKSTTPLSPASRTASQKLAGEVSRRRIVEKKLRLSQEHAAMLTSEMQRMQTERRLLTNKIMNAHEEERKEISRELHDEIAQILAGINIHLAGLKKEASGNTRDLRMQISKTQRLVEKSVSVVQQFARKLRPVALDDLGLVAALRAYVNEFQERTHIPIIFKSDANVKDPGMKKRTALYRVAQSALTNVAEHAQASCVTLTMTMRPRSIRMIIKDNGKSFEAEKVFLNGRRKCLGLIGMRERLHIVGGRLTIVSAAGEGTSISAEVPMASGSES